MKNFVFKLFTRRIDVKISKIDEGNKRIDFLTKKLMKELESQGLYSFDGVCNSIAIFEHKDVIQVVGSDYKKQIELSK